MSASNSKPGSFLFKYNTYPKGRALMQLYRVVSQTKRGIEFRAQFYNTLIRLRVNPIYFIQNYTYFKQFYQECLKQNI